MRPSKASRPKGMLIPMTALSLSSIAIAGDGVSRIVRRKRTEKGKNDVVVMSGG